MVDVSSLVETGATRNNQEVSLEIVNKDLEETTLMTNKANTIKIEPSYTYIFCLYKLWCTLSILTSIHSAIIFKPEKYSCLMTVPLWITLAHC